MPATKATIRGHPPHSQPLNYRYHTLIFLNHFAFKAIQYFSLQVSHVQMHWCSGGNEDMRLIHPNLCDKTIEQFGLKFLHNLIRCHDTFFQCTILSTKLILICACLSSMMMKVASHGQDLLCLQAMGMYPQMLLKVLDSQVKFAKKYEREQFIWQHLGG